jgi:hypothetical protein
MPAAQPPIAGFIAHCFYLEAQMRWRLAMPTIGFSSLAAQPQRLCAPSTPPAPEKCRLGKKTEVIRKI